MTVNDFLKTETIKALEKSLSKERIATYISATKGNLDQAVWLYTWNTALGAAFYAPLQCLEVVLRNAMHQALSVCYGLDWCDNRDCCFDIGTMTKLTSAKEDLRRNGQKITPPNLLPVLPFGFWVALMGRGGDVDKVSGQRRNYEMTLWRPALCNAFPYTRLPRVEVFKIVNGLRVFRNRIAHHEPIFARHLEQDYNHILTVTGWICPNTRDWIARHSRVEYLLQLPKYTQSLTF